ncbi:UNVERIFIED_CONTAM: protein CYPRO4 [Sesamum radiatum]|uniref:Protein CYPRO4 n=1 Tax=Sesamum radiatum TaxID=300843 RepID=A0AAW2PZ86_SESRA
MIVKELRWTPQDQTFLGLDDNRLCRWDMRDRRGMVQNIVNESTPVLNWTQGHQFSRGTNFQCFATTGDGSIVVGSLDGKIRLYSISSMRQAKTAFPGLGSPITHVDVTYDGKWILGTTDTYLILICSLFTDKDGKTKTGLFSGRMGNRIAAPRLLKLNPLDSHMAGANKFRNAQFSWVTENGKQERHLVATVGKFSVIWNFQQVKDGSHECYRISGKRLPNSGELWLLSLPRKEHKTSSIWEKTNRLAKNGSTLRCHRVVVKAQGRPTWLPGLDPPPYLDGTLAGDFGFDPLGLGEDPESLKWYVQAELVHARFAMAGVAGILVTDLLRVTGISILPVWFEAGATKFDFASTRTLLVVQLLLMGFVETKRYMDFRNPGSQAKEGSFFGLEAALEGLEPGYPGGPLLNPLGLAKDIKNA